MDVRGRCIYGQEKGKTGESTIGEGGGEREDEVGTGGRGGREGEEREEEGGQGVEEKGKEMGGGKFLPPRSFLKVGTYGADTENAMPENIPDATSILGVKILRNI